MLNPQSKNMAARKGLSQVAGEDHVGAMSLAQADTQTESKNYSNVYAGAAFGVVGLAATFVLISTCSK